MPRRTPYVAVPRQPATTSDVVVQLPTKFPAFAIVLSGEPFLAVYDSGEGLRLMAARPSRTGKRKLTDEQRLEITRRVAAGHLVAEIARDMGVHRRTIEGWHKKNEARNQARSPSRRKVLSDYLEPG